jgi:hypothetical protein
MHTGSKGKKDQKEGYHSIILREVTIKEEEEDSEVMEEEDLAEEEAQLYVITVTNLGIWCRLSESLHDMHLL